MPRCLERKATESGIVRARSHSRCGAVVRRSLSRSTVTAIVRFSRAWLDLKFYSFIEFYIASPVKQRRRSAALPPRRGAPAHPFGHQARKFPGDVRHIDIFPALPARCRIAHAKDGKRRQANVEIGAELASGDTLPDHVLEDALEPARPAPDAAAALARQMLALVEEHLDEIGPVDQRRQVRFDQRNQALSRALRPGGNRLGRFEKALDPFEADDLQRR